MEGRGAPSLRALLGRMVLLTLPHTLVPECPHTRLGLRGPLHPEPRGCPIAPPRSWPSACLAFWVLVEDPGDLGQRQTTVCQAWLGHQPGRDFPALFPEHDPAGRAASYREAEIRAPDSCGRDSPPAALDNLERSPVSLPGHAAPKRPVVLSRRPQRGSVDSGPGSCQPRPRPVTVDVSAASMTRRPLRFLARLSHAGSVQLIRFPITPTRPEQTHTWCPASPAESGPD